MPPPLVKLLQAKPAPQPSVRDRDALHVPVHVVQVRRDLRSHGRLVEQLDVVVLEDDHGVGHLPQRDPRVHR